MIMNYLTLFYTHLKWVLDILTYYPFNKLHDSNFSIIGEMYDIYNYEHTKEDVECVV